MEYAIVEAGGSQFKVKKGDVIKVGKFGTDSKKSAKISKVLLYNDGKNIEVGSPYIKGAHVTCDVIKEEKAKKVIAYKYRKRKSSKFKKGHRRKLLVLKVKDISLKGE
ncbi:MAG: 50S ribosomal protein L21 [Candidatus Omnitrophota bacterium]|nr:50S ribosomal protein L21 [Candidatus Omnitrophota bacterium]